jgi:predicted flavoprotein YhiN
MMRSLLADVFPAALATELCRLAGLAEDVAVAHVKRPQRLALAAVITSLPLTVRATESWDRAMITRGGVALRDVDPGTLQSRLTPGVFFAGEVLDLDAPSGGYNLQWAFSSGWLAGASAAKAAMKPR